MVEVILTICLHYISYSQLLTVTAVVDKCKITTNFLKIHPKMQFSLIQIERKVLYILPIVCVEVESVEVNRPINVDDDVSSSLNPVEIRLIIIKDCVQYLNSLKIKQK